MHPKPSQRQEIYTLWKTYFGFDDGGWINDYFQRNFSLDTCYIRMQNEEIVATLCAHPHRMSLQGHTIPITFIIGVITKKEHQHKGHMHALFEDFFTETKRTAGLYVLQAYHPEIYTSSGFVMQYVHTRYLLDACPEPVLPLTDAFCAADLFEINKQFLEAYDGYIERDLAWYENLLVELQVQGYLLQVVERNHKKVGYSLSRMQEDGTHLIEELQYTDLTACESLLAHARKQADRIEVNSFVPLPYAQPIQTEQALMVRLGNTTILKNILQRDIHSLADVYENMNKPIYHYGFW